MSYAMSAEMQMRPILSSLSTLETLKEALQIPEVNTGQILNYRGIVSDDNEGLHAIVDQHGYVRLSSGVEMAMCMYRGQPDEYLPCLPTLGRLKTVERQFLALCRNVAFEEAIGEHPYVRVAEEADFLGNPLYIDKQGLAQHYGLATDMIDLTSNFDVASFFAVCRWNEHENRYTPVNTSSKPGVIYRIIPALLTGIVLTENGEEVFDYVGWQPLHRPEQQRACSVKLRNGQDFLRLPTVQKMYFRHSADVSDRIWNAFDQGAALFPDDAAATLAAQARQLGSFSRAQVARAWIKLESWLGRIIAESERIQTERRVVLEFVDKPVLRWDGLAIERDETRLRDQLNEVLNHVHFRRVAYPKAGLTNEAPESGTGDGAGVWRSE